MEGEQQLPGMSTTVRTFSKVEPIWDHRCSLPIRRALVEGEWRLPECSWMDFEVYLEPRARAAREVLLGHWTVQLEEVLADIGGDPVKAAEPQARKLYAPHGEGPYNELKAAVLGVGFEQRNEESIDCIIASADGLPENLGGTVYVRVHIRQAVSGRARRLPPPKYREKTRIVRRSADPFFDDVLELEVPVNLTDRQLVYGPELYLHFEVYDTACSPFEDLMATLSLPLASALQADGQDPRPYSLMLAPSVKYDSKMRKRGSLRKTADADAEFSDDVVGLLPLSRLHLGFQAIIPCQVQLRCTVEYAHAVPTMAQQSAGSGAPAINIGISAPIVRMSFVEGNPLLAHATAARTLTWKQALRAADSAVSPVWDEKCMLHLPSWIWEVSLSKGPPDPFRASVREGWEHEHRHEPQEPVVCADVYDRDTMGYEKFLGRAIVPFSHAYTAAREGTGRQPRPVSLTCLPDAFLWLGFELGADDDEFVVIVAHADEIPTDTSSGQAAMSVIVRIADLGAFYTPTDRADLHCVAKAQTPPAEGSPHDPVWQHEELLELPGGEIDSVVAVRPDWFLLFEVLDSDPRADEAPPLAVAAAPLSDVLSQTSEAQAPEKTSLVLQKRLQNARAVKPPATSKIAAAPGTKIDATVPIVRELPLVVRRNALTAQDQPQVPSTDLASRFRQVGKSLTKSFSRSFSRSRLVDLESLPEMPQPSVVLEDGFNDDDRVLVVRFEVLSRWKGTGGGAKCPPTRPMLGPSPVTSLVALISSVVAGHDNGNIFVWDVTGSSNLPLHQFQAHKVCISCMVYLPTLDCIVTTATAKTRKEAVSESLLRVWNCSTFELRQTVPLHGAGSRCLVPVSLEGKNGSSILALAKDNRQSTLLQLFKLDTT